MNLVRSFLVTAILNTGFLCAQQTASVPSSQSFVRANAVQFAQGKSAPLLADMYLPQRPGFSPAIVFIHGGGWQNGDRTQMSRLISLLADHGYVGMAIDYDLSPSVHFPVALQECKEAVRWLRAHATEYHVDANRIAVAGSSAGGELAALVATTSGDPRYEGQGAFSTFSSSVKAAIIYNAVLDLSAFPENDGSVLKYLGSSCSTQRDLCTQASPQFNIGPTPPPIFAGHGNADKVVPYAQFTKFVATYRKANGVVTEFTAEQGPHTYWAKPQWFQANAEATLQFLKKNL